MEETMGIESLRGLVADAPNKTPEENLVPSPGKVRSKIVVRIRARLSLAAPDI
jgi:hypothetical protein